jgi:hypothetical protein
VQLDSASLLNETTRSNNSITKSFSIAEDEVRPVYPLNFAIVNTANIKLTATTNQFLQVPKSFIVEVDTTENFNSPIKVSQTQSSIGGVIEFSPVIPLKDSVVFYWRVAKVSDTGVINRWSNSSFVYIPTSSSGWSQSHYFQYLKDNYEELNFDQLKELKFNNKTNSLRVTSQIHPYGFNTVANGLEVLFNSSCFNAINSLEFLIINQRKGTPIINTLGSNNTQFNSIKPYQCNIPQLYQFWFYYNRSEYRKYAMDFIDKVPNGSILVLNNWCSATYNYNPEFIQKWKQDTVLFGAGNSIYHKLKNIGFTKIDSFSKNVPFSFIALKDVNGFWQVLDQKIGNSVTDVLTSEINYESLKNNGNVNYTLIGPAKSWSSIHWSGYSLEPNSADEINYKVFGVSNNFSETLLYSSSSKQKDTSLAYINANVYPYLKIYQENSDKINNSPWQTKYLQVKYEPVPEGALTPASQVPLKDTLDVGEPIKFNIAFKNISPVAFDSVKLFMTLTDPLNNTKVVFDGKRKPIKMVGDTILVDYTLDTKNLVGDNSVYINFNPDNAQPEQYMFNNYLNKNIYVRPDTYAPNLDVTFDGLHILNKDIVSPKPTILVKLKDDSKFLALNDTSLFSVKLRYPNGALKAIKFDNDTLLFTPAMLSVGSTENTASVTFKPYLKEDGEYELIVSGKDRSNNASGAFEYRVMFDVYNKSMITNLLNYPNPFTSSTAFVFTLTGSELPSGFRIQILTVTGKIVKEIVKEELGPIRIGNNITEYKWDGTDMFGQPLANGVYLYRVITDIRGKKIDKLKTSGFNTDKYFQSGYGKMYLMR